MNDTAGDASVGWLDKFAGWVKQFIDAVAHARIPPDSMPIVPEQGIINVLTGGIGVTLYTVAAFVLAGSRLETLASQLMLSVISAILLFVAAIIVLAIAKGPREIQELWLRLSSVFMVLWLLSLVVFLLLTYPSLLLSAGQVNLLDAMAYGLTNRISDHPWAVRDDIAKAFICALLAGLFVLYRTRMLDPNFSLKSSKPWVWLVMMTLVVGFVMEVALFQSWRNS